jgi:hypothetical protein
MRNRIRMGFKDQYHFLFTSTETIGIEGYPSDVQFPSVALPAPIQRALIMRIGQKHTERLGKGVVAMLIPVLMMTVFYTHHICVVILFSTAYLNLQSICTRFASTSAHSKAM